MKQIVRIIGGQFRGKKITFPDLPGLRPTPNRVRETLFNWLMHHIQGKHCLDAFAGSGALGFEAWSRGASQVTFIEQSPAACRHLKKYINAFASPALSLVETHTIQYLSRHISAPFDIVFLDPPFDEPSLLKESVTCLEKNNLLVPTGLVYIESDHPVALHVNVWETIKEKKTGLVYYGLYRKRQIP